MTITTNHIATDQHWQDETTIYWFEIDGTDYGTGFEFENETVGIAESGGEDQILDADGCPMTEGDDKTVAVRRNCTVTDEMRKAG